MADTFKLTGGYTLTPTTSPTSFAQSAEAPIDETVSLKSRTYVEVELTADTPIAVPFGGVTNANVIIMKALGGKVRARVTSADGATQAVPFDTYWILMSDSVAVTAIDLTRVAGTATTVRVLLGEKA